MENIAEANGQLRLAQHAITRFQDNAQIQAHAGLDDNFMPFKTTRQEALEEALSELSTAADALEQARLWIETELEAAE